MRVMFFAFIGTGECDPNKDVKVIAGYLAVLACLLVYGFLMKKVFRIQGSALYRGFYALVLSLVFLFIISKGFL